MIRREEGFTLVELIITMFIFVLILTATSNTFVDLLKDFKKQSKQAETNIEGAVGLEILRRDIASAGYGLPWVIAAGVTYNEAGNDTNTTHDDTQFNESCFSPVNNCANSATAAQPPHAFVSGNGTGSFGSDILSIKSVSVRTDAAAQKWTYVNSSNQVKEWTPASDNLVTSDRVIVLSLGTTDATRRTLIADGTDFTTTYRADTSPDSLADASFKPTDAAERYIVYGVTDQANPVTTDLRMPFNRADYYIQRPATYLSTCAPNTGALYKAVVSQGSTGGVAPVMPILDCVADMQLTFRRDSDDDGDIDNTYDGALPASLSASEIRQIKEVRVYILAHEGQQDMSYTYPSTTIRVGDVSLSVGRDLDITGNLNYRWKLYVLVVKTENLK